MNPPPLLGPPFCSLCGTQGHFSMHCPSLMYGSYTTPPVHNQRRNNPMQGMIKTASEGAFSCTVCDRGFDSKRDLDTHIAAHTKCSYEGCDFSAQRKIVLAHQMREHQKGKMGGTERISLPPSLLELIPEKYRGAAAVGDSEEEIARWREERRKNFPTLDNVERKRKRMEEATSRGVLQTAPTSGKLRRTAPPSQTDASGAHAPPSRQGNSDQGDTAAQANAKQFGENDANSSDSDAPDEMGVGLMDATVEAKTLLESANKHAETTLAEETRLGILPTGSTPRKVTESKRPVCRAFAARGRCRKGNSCRYLHSKGDTSKAGRSVCKWYLLGNCGQGNRCSYSHAANDTGPNSGLLRSLLSSEIQEETSAVLQGIRYIVKNNFFMDNK